VPRTKTEAQPAGPALVDPEAAAKLQAAADAVGLTLAQLVDLVHDSGALSVPPDSPDGITTPLTLKDLGKRMWAELNLVLQPERAAWFEALLHPQQVALIVTLADQGFRPEIIGRELGVASTKVRSALDQYADRIGAQVTQIRLSTIAGHVQMAAERAMSGLQSQENWTGYFAVQEKVVKILQSLGIVDQAIHRVEVTHVVDNTKSEIDAMLELERKQRKRQEEIEQARRVVVDAVPQLEFEREV
jgi:hypothetical protein